MAGESYILMGVSGSGKSLIGSKIATLFSAKLLTAMISIRRKTLIKCLREYR
ncbi:D-gluconate kinase [Salmonella enterica subsp. enterica serovar Typhimurium]|nr:D-gluconate kinase [Salmonella enterica subsp. enterica serovar Typhimurium]